MKKFNIISFQLLSTLFLLSEISFGASSLQTGMSPTELIKKSDDPSLSGDCCLNAVSLTFLAVQAMILNQPFDPRSTMMALRITDPLAPQIVSIQNKVDEFQKSAFIRSLSPRDREDLLRLCFDWAQNPREDLNGFIIEKIESAEALSSYFQLAGKLGLSRLEAIAITPENYFKFDRIGWTVDEIISLICYLRDPLVSSKLQEAKTIIAAHFKK